MRLSGRYVRHFCSVDLPLTCKRTHRRLHKYARGVNLRHFTNEEDEHTEMRSMRSMRRKIELML